MVKLREKLMVKVREKLMVKLMVKLMGSCFKILSPKSCFLIVHYINKGNLLRS